MNKFCSPGGIAQHFSILCHNDCQLLARIGLLETLGQIPGVEVAVDLGHLVAVGILPAQLDGGDPAVSIRRKVTAYNAVALSARAVTGGADLTGVDGIVAEV